MSFATSIANKVISVLKKQVIEKGYEVTTELSKVERDTSTINDTGGCDIIQFTAEIKVIITRHDVSLFPMALGDNPEDLLDFIWIVRDEEDFVYSPEEGMYLNYMDNNYIVTAVSPTYLAGRLIMKECRGRKTR